MAIAYLLLAFWVVADHFERLPEVFMLIFKKRIWFTGSRSRAIGYGIRIEAI